MSYPGTRSAREAVLTVLTESELAEWRRAEGKRVVQRHGRWWEEIKPGFYHAVHWMARQRGHEIERPAAWCWGFRTTLHHENAALANGCLPVHLLSDLRNYEIDALPRRRRNKLRKARRLNTVVEVIEPTLLRDQGYDVRRSVARRLGMWEPPSEGKYLAELDDYVRDPRRLILAGVAEGRLGAYLDAFAVDGTAYIDHVYIHSDAFSREVGTALVFELVQACRRSASIREVVYGLDVPSNPNLKEFKVKMGFPVVRVPAIYRLVLLAGRLLRWWRPEVHYRITGSAC